MNHAAVSAAKCLVEILVAEQVSHIFCVPGESYLAVLDALVDVEDKIQVICCRHEAGAANMAAAFGKLTGRPGICMVTRGPGATHASVGLHTAQQDSAPMILFVGQVARQYKGREAFQELDYRAVFHSMAKWVAEIDHPEQVTEMLFRAFSVATQGRPGPVVLALPEDVLCLPVETAQIGRSSPPQVTPSDSQLKEIAERFRDARRPIAILGGSGWSTFAIAQFERWSQDHAIPVALSFRRKDLFNNDHPYYAGDLGLGCNPKLIRRIQDADLVLTIGSRLSEITSQSYSLFTPSDTQHKLIHIHPDPNELGRVWPAAIGITGDSSSAALAISSIALDSVAWSEWSQRAHTDYEEFTMPVETTGPVNPSLIFGHLSNVMPGAIVCNGAGNYAAWLHRFYRHRKPHTQLGPTSGAMGFGLPAAIAAKCAHPEREVVAVAGDGCFMMSGQEIATAIQYGINVIIIVFDNGALGTIRMHQEREYPNRVMATNLKNPDFVAFARSFGAWATLIEKTEDFPDALEEARAQAGVSLLHIKMSLRDIAPGRTILNKH